MQEQEIYNQNMPHDTNQNDNQYTQTKSPEKNSSLIIIVLLSILAAAGAGFGIYGMFFNNSNIANTDCPICADSEVECPKCQNCEEKECSGSIEKTALDKALVKVAMEQYIAKKPSGPIPYFIHSKPQDIANMLNDENLKMLYVADRAGLITNPHNTNYYEYNEYYKQYFNQDAPKHDFSASCSGYIYQENSNGTSGEYLVDTNKTGCGGFDPNIMDYYVKDWGQDGNDIIIDLILIELKDSIEEQRHYRKITFKDGSTMSFDCTDNLCSNAIDQPFADENSSKLPHFILTLSKVEDHFIIKSASIEE